MNKSDILIQLSYHINFSEYGGLEALKKRTVKDLKDLWESVRGW